MMQELLKQSEEREKERVKMFNEKEETQKAKNEMFDQRENDLDKMLSMKEKLIDKKERDFEKQTAQMEREQEDADATPQRPTRRTTPTRAAAMPTTAVSSSSLREARSGARTRMRRVRRRSSRPCLQPSRRSKRVPRSS